jgi:xanthine dehydrogenase YagS FAD-binding subunit
MLPSFAYVRARSTEEAVRQLARPGARAHAGGTDLLGCLRDRVFAAETVVSLSDLEGLRGIRESAGGGLAIGALTTLTEVQTSPLVHRLHPGLAQAASEVASPQLRHQGTVGGNLCQRPRCWYYRGDFACAKKGGELCYAVAGENRYHALFGGGPCYIVHPSDTAPMLSALDASLAIAGPAGERALPLADFFVLPAEDLSSETVLAPGEIVTEVRVPPPAAGQVSLYRKVRERGAWDFALTSLALSVLLAGDRVEAARMVLGGVAPIPWRVPAAEAAITGRRLDAATRRAAAEAAAAGAEPLAQNAYKVLLVQAVVEESLAALAAA